MNGNGEIAKDEAEKALHGFCDDEEHKLHELCPKNEQEWEEAEGFFDMIDAKHDKDGKITMKEIWDTFNEHCGPPPTDD